MEHRDDNHYIEKVMAGETAAFAFLVNRHKDLVYTIALKILQSREDAEEVAQDAFVKAFQKLATFRKDSKFSTWLYRIAYNEAISKTRLRKFTEVELVEEISESTADEEVENGVLGLSYEEQRKAIDIVMKRLPEPDQLLITLFYLQGMPISEICEITGLSESNAKVRLHRLRKRIYVELNEILSRKVFTF
jgi:RNA polymerase sigma-70 factor (ECF subfamily)